MQTSGAYARHLLHRSWDATPPLRLWRTAAFCYGAVAFMGEATVFAGDLPDLAALRSERGQQFGSLDVGLGRLFGAARHGPDFLGRKTIQMEFD